MKALHIDDLQKRYPTGVEALRGVSIDIEPGAIYGLLGPNGAGKSTLIHCTTGLAQPTGGTIEIFGHDAIGNYAQARAPRARQGAAGDLLPDREARRTHPHPLRRDETAADPGAGDHAPAAPA